MSKKDFGGFDDILVDDDIVSDLPVESSGAVDIHLVKRNPHQPRFFENEEEVDDLMDSIQGAYNDLLSTNNFDDSRIKPEDGLLQPIIVSPCDDGTFVCVGGHRRLEACKRLGHKTIKANIVKLDESQLVVFSIVENLQRVNLTPFETALAIDKAIHSRAFDSEKKLADALGKSSSFISKCKNVLKLPAAVLDDLHKDRADIGLEILNDLQRLQSSVTAEDLYFKYKKGEIRGWDIREAIKEEKKVSTRKAPMFTRKGKTITLSIDCSDDVMDDINLDHLYIDLFEKMEELKETYKLNQELEQPKINYMEVLKDHVYLEFSGGDVRSVPFSVAKSIIKNIHHVQMEIVYKDCSGTQEGSDFLNNIPRWSYYYCSANDVTSLRYDAK
jgi:ParB/RepB/Spo0J family partition protein